MLNRPNNPEILRQDCAAYETNMMELNSARLCCENAPIRLFTSVYDAWLAEHRLFTECDSRQMSNIFSPDSKFCGFDLLWMLKGFEVESGKRREI